MQDAQNPATGEQDEVFAFLGDPSAYGSAERPIRIDTHAASVFLAGERALKVKRAIRFPFLDYSSLDKREAACRAEIDVNRPFAPEIYRGVIPVTREADGRLSLSGQGQVVEWAVDMRRFDERATLDHVADRHGIDGALADALGRAVAHAHACAPPADAPAWIAALENYLDQNDSDFRTYADLFAADRVATLDRAGREAFARVRPLLRERGERGLIRRGHGDLHLGNIVLIDGKPVLFDAIEFDPVIASGDVLYDLAFLLMDLIERGHADAANMVFNRYLIETRRPDDLDALAALPLFLSLRAAIRAKVTAAKIERAGQRERPAIEQAARSYFDLACALIAPPPPCLVAIGGLSGTGKSVLARGLAPAIKPEPGAVVLRSDIERKTLFGLGETERLPETAYTSEVTAKVYAAIADKARRAIAAGHSAIADAVFAKEHERSLVAQIAKDHGVRFVGFFLTADLATRTSRVEVRMDDASDAGAAVARQQESYDLGSLDWTKVDASGTPEQTLARAIRIARPAP